jgi:hypothetical protein
VLGSRRFTLNLCTDAEAHSDGCPIPLAKSGICSGIFGDGPEQKLYIDGMNTHGFSGGPLLCSNEAGVFGAIGVVSGYEHRVVKARYYQEETGSGSRKHRNYDRIFDYTRSWGLAHVVATIGKTLWAMLGGSGTSNLWLVR